MEVRPGQHRRFSARRRRETECHGHGMDGRSVGRLTDGCRAHCDHRVYGARARVSARTYVYTHTHDYHDVRDTRELVGPRSRADIAMTTTRFDARTDATTREYRRLHHGDTDKLGYAPVIRRVRSNSSAQCQRAGNTARIRSAVPPRVDTLAVAATSTTSSGAIARMRPNLIVGK